jgi:hypothetical protein
MLDNAMFKDIASKNGDRPWRVGEIQGTQWLYPAWGVTLSAKSIAVTISSGSASDRESQMAQLLATIKSVGQ